MKNYNQQARDIEIDTVKKSLEANGIKVLIAKSKEAARDLMLSQIPEGGDVMTHTSMTLDELGVSDVINNSGKYISVRRKSREMDREKENKKILEIRSAPTYSIGSFHAVTLDGKIMLASGSGSQIPGYAYGSEKVIFAAGSQKIVKDLNEGFDRIYNHSLPLESERIGGSNARKILIINSDGTNGRITVILIKESIGF